MTWSREIHGLRPNRSFFEGCRGTVRLLLLVGTHWVGIVACGTSDHRSKLEFGGGPLTYSNSDSALTAGGAFASVVVAWPGLRVLSNIGGTPTLGLVEPTHVNCSGFPVAVGAGTLGGNSVAVVSDPGCGVWVANVDMEAVTTRAWSDFFEPVDADHNVLVDDVDADGDGDVIIGGSTGFVACRAGVGRTCHRYVSSLPFAFPGLIQPVVVVLHGAFGVDHSVFFMRDGSPEVVPLEATGLGEPIALKQRPTEFLKPFARFDQLVAVTVPGCAAFALGVGAFDERANYSARHPQILETATDETFVATTLSTNLDETYAISAVTDDTGDVFVISIGERTGVTHLEAGRIVDCNSFETLAIGEVEFEWRTPRAPEEFTESNLPHLGVQLESRATGPASLATFHFDGFTLRRFDLDLVKAAISQHNTEF